MHDHCTAVQVSLLCNDAEQVVTIALTAEENQRAAIIAGDSEKLYEPLILVLEPMNLQRDEALGSGWGG